MSPRRTASSARRWPNRVRSRKASNTWRTPCRLPRRTTPSPARPWRNGGRRRRRVRKSSAPTRAAAKKNRRDPPGSRLPTSPRQSLLADGDELHDLDFLAAEVLEDVDDDPVVVLDDDLVM